MFFNSFFTSEKEFSKNGIILHKSSFLADQSFPSKECIFILLTEYEYKDE
ncbi:hypothetical protein [Bacillus sp. ISL-45]|nr:hypothetical protein [Bacillus sp. ISL-45]